MQGIGEAVTEGNAAMISKRQKIELLSTMLKMRSFELAVNEHFQVGDIPGFAHLYVGEEAVAAGVCAVLNQDDTITSTHRGHGHCIAKGADLNRLMAELYGRASGLSRGRGGSMHIYAKEIGILGTGGIVAGAIPLSLGAAMHARLTKTHSVCVCFFGDGAANSGTFHESINLAAVKDLPVIFVCENNLYATEIAVHLATRTKDFAERATGYGIPGAVVDGNDVLDVLEHANRAVKHARTGKGPTLLECKTYRHCGHYIGEPGTSYRSQEEVAAWMARDPITLFSEQLIKEGIATRSRIEKLRREADDKVQEAVAFAESSPWPEPHTAMDYI